MALYQQRQIGVRPHPGRIVFTQRHGGTETQKHDYELHALWLRALVPLCKKAISSQSLKGLGSKKLLFRNPRPDRHQIVEPIDGLAGGPGNAAEDERAEERIVEGPGIVPEDRHEDPPFAALVGPQ